MADINFEESYKDSIAELNTVFNVIFTDKNHKAILSKEGNTLFLHISGILNKGYAEFPLRILSEIIKLLKTGLFNQISLVTNGTISLELNQKLDNNIDDLNKFFYTLTEIKKIYSMEL